MAGSPGMDLDDVTKKLAKQLSDDEHIEALGKSFGISRKEVSRYIDINYKGRGIGFHGTEKMIEKWIEERPPERSDIPNILNDLRSCLVKAKLVRVSETIPKDQKEAVPKGCINDEPQDDGECDPDIEPDVDGYYKHRLQVAIPTSEQLNKTENYKMDSRRKGFAFILNIANFPKRPEKNRLGSELDAENVQHVFAEIGYETILKQDLKRDNIVAELDELVKKIQADKALQTSLVLVLMSHGGVNEKGEQYIRASDGKSVTIKELIKKLSPKNCPELENKPKMIFVQACRGALAGVQADSDVLHPTPSWEEECPEEDEDTADSGISPAEPAVADLYLANATADEFISMRHHSKGSWFIQAVCEEFLCNAHKNDLNTMMIRVTRRVRRMMTKKKKSLGGKQIIKQAPEMRQIFEKKLYFLPKYPPGK